MKFSKIPLPGPRGAIGLFHPRMSRHRRRRPGGFFVEHLIVPHSALGGQPANLEQQRYPVEVHHGDLRVGRLPLVLVAEPSAHADDRLGQRGAGDHPAGLVHLVDALIADVAVAGIPEPVPVVMHQISVEGLLWCRSQPQVEVQSRRRLLDFFEADAVAPLEARAARNQQLALLAFGDVLGQLLPTCTAAALRAVLYDALVLLGGLDALAPLEHVVAARLLDVNVLAGLARPDGH